MRATLVDDGLEPGSLLAELFESIAQFVPLRTLGQLTHIHSVHRGVRASVINFNSRAKGKLFGPLPSKDTSVWLEDLASLIQMLKVQELPGRDQDR
jgi:hypothetical protein